MVNLFVYQVININCVYFSGSFSMPTELKILKRILLYYFYITCL